MLIFLSPGTSGERSGERDECYCSVCRSSYLLTFLRPAGLPDSIYQQELDLRIGTMKIISIHHSGMTANEFSKRLLEEEKVAVIPGNAFGQCGEGFIRCSYVVSTEAIEEALERMGRFVRRHG